MGQDQKYCTIYLVRHGETEHNVNEIVQGHVTDSPLTPAGTQQAQKRAEELKHIHFDAIFSSDLGRAKTTAEILKLNRQLAVNIAKLLRERHFGPFEGSSIEEYIKINQHLFDKLKTLSEKEKRAFKIHPETESNDEIAARMLTFLREAAATYLGKTLLVVSHGSIIRATLMHLGFAKYDELPAGNVENLAYVVLKSDGVEFFIKETKGINKQI